MTTFVLSTIVLLYLFSITFLGYKGYKQTKNAKDYLVAGRNVHPFVMAMSYGATFISSSAIIGFGGVAAYFGEGLIWLTFLNILIGIIIAFIFFGRKTRIIGRQIDAHTFPEFLGARFQSKSIQVFAGSIIFIAMPLYAAVVLKGGAVFIEQIFNIDYNIALFIFTLIIAAYVIAGGLKGVMYTDALQGSIMFVSMFILLFWTYKNLGMGFSEANRELGAMAHLVPEKLRALGHTGWTSMPEVGSTWWYTLFTSLILGVGIGVLAQPQLVVRFMTVNSNKELNRAVLIGSIFIFVSTGVIYTVGAVSNLYFFREEGKLSLSVVKDMDKIIPYFINSATPAWFAAIFMLCILSASMSTLSSQFHAMGTSIGRDVVGSMTKNNNRSTLITRLGIMVSIILSYMICYVLNFGVIARGTAIFFGICAATFLPAYVSALYFKNVSKHAILTSMVTGFIASLFALLFLHSKESSVLGVCDALFGRSVLVLKMPWPVLDPIVFALPAAIIALIVVNLAAKRTPLMMNAKGEGI